MLPCTVADVPKPWLISRKVFEKQLLRDVGHGFLMATDYKTSVTDIRDRSQAYPFTSLDMKSTLSFNIMFCFVFQKICLLLKV